MILAGDIGGTNTRLACFAQVDGRLEPVVQGTFPSREYPSLEAIVGEFARVHGLGVEAACFGVAGPVRMGRAVVTNLPWVVDADSLARRIQLPAVDLLNDLEATAQGARALTPRDVRVLSASAPRPEGARSGNAAVIAAGTGLGEAGLYWDGSRHHVFACEGGHADFGPRTALEVELLRYLLTR